MATITRRRMFSLTALAGASGALAACSNGSPSPGTSTTGGGASGGASLVTQIWDANQRNGVQAAIDAYTKAHEGTTVRLDLMPEDQFYQTLDSSLAAGEGPDVFWQSSRAIEYIKGGAIEALDERIASAGIDLGQYSPVITELYKFDGKQYGIPKDMDAWVMVYNEALFEKAGVATPTAEWTWDDMVRTAQELLAATGDRGNILGYNTGLVNGCSDSVHQLGGRYISEDGTKSLLTSDECVAGFTRIMELMDAGLVPNPSDRADFDVLGALMSGALPIATVPSWQISAVAEAASDKLPLAAVRLPSTKGDFRCNTNGLSYMLNTNSKSKDQGFELLAFLTSLEGATLHAANGAGLPAIPAAQDAWFKKNGAIQGIDAVREASQNVYLRPSTAFPKARPGISEAQTNILPQLWAKSLTIPEALGQMNDIIQRALDS